jgi:hypothetical protein
LGLGICRQDSYRGFFGGSDCFAEEPYKSYWYALGSSMKLELDVNEINFILQTLGELPSKSGVWPLILKIKEQAEAQVSQVTEEVVQ